MAYGTVKVDNITFDNGGSDQNVTVSGLYRATTSGVTVTGTISGAVLVGTTTVSGATVTGTIVQGTTVQGVSGTFTSLTGITTSGTTANFVSGVFTTQVSGTTITGTTSSFTSGNFATLSGATATFTSGVIASGTAANPSLSILGDPNTGAYSPGADQLGIVTNGVERIKFGSTEVVINDGGTDYDLRIEGDTNSTLFCVDASTDRVGIGTSSPTTILDVNGDVKATGIFSSAAGTAAAPSIAFTGDLNTGIYSPGADQLAVATNGTGRLFVAADGKVGVGTSTPNGLLTVAVATAGTAADFVIGNPANLWSIKTGTTTNALTIVDTQFSAERLRIDTLGNVGIGTTSPSATLELSGTGTVFKANTAATTSTAISLQLGGLATSSNSGCFIKSHVNLGSTLNSQLSFEVNGGALEAARIDSSGRLLVGTSTARSNFYNTTASAGFQLEGTGTNRRAAIIGDDAEGVLIVAAQRSGAVGGNQVLVSSDPIGAISFQGSDGSEFLEAATIFAFVDGTPGANDMPGRLVFSTTADGAASPTERLRITSAGNVGIGTSSPNYQLDVGTVGRNSTGELLLTAGNSASNDYTQSTLLRLRATSINPNQGNHSDAASVAEIRLNHIDRPGNSSSGNISFYTNPDNFNTAVTERMRIGSDGTTIAFSPGADTFIARNANGAGTTNNCIICTHSSTGMGDGSISLFVKTNGNVQNTNNSYGAISDIKLKENIVDATSQWNDIKALQVRKYNFKEGQTHTQIGLIAQEVELVSPGLVTESPDRDEDGNDLGTVTKGIHYSVLYMKAVKALQEAMERIETLEARLTAAGI